ncbi:ABC-type sugar transport system ATPase subunit [Alkalibacillus filiformis]|uniref:ABC-type sugar transport system ATPase subunit n=1 Tax=Alkalibacillus filiformis TaxID=200990 RepID=A0ABU0DVM8_9BACI|nr:ABC-type sugar transport system ATPase subunit [Alkalibacillus filiformis]
MDEPLSNLDAKLRVQMRTEIQKLHQRLQTTTIYVTHDQTEAMTMATRLVVMKDGVVQQVGSPKEVFDYPNNVFVGGFIGSPAMNFFNGTIEDGAFKVGDTTFEIPEGRMKILRDQGYVGKGVAMGVRPEDIHDEPVFIENSPGTAFESNVEVAELMGSETYLYSRLGEQEYIARVDARTQVNAGDSVKLAIDMNKVHFFDSETEERIK